MVILLHMKSGKDLKLQRVAADVKTKDLASAMGVTASRVSRIENTRTVTPDAEGKYLEALFTCITKSTWQAA